MKTTLDQDRLWELLGQIPQAEVSPWFTTKVMAQVRSLELEQTTWLSGWKKFFAPLGALSGAAAAVMMAFFLISPTNSTVAQLESEAEVFAALDSFLDARVLANTVWSGN